MVKLLFAHRTAFAHLKVAFEDWAAAAIGALAPPTSPHRLAHIPAVFGRGVGDGVGCDVCDIVGHVVSRVVHVNYGAFLALTIGRIVLATGCR